MKKIKISKLDAARRQLLTAIRLYFNDGDVVSTHTLAAAALKITQNICDSSPDLADSVTSWVDAYIKPERKKEFWRKLHETANFFKHAKNDPDAVHEFCPEETENILFLAACQYYNLSWELLVEMRLFGIWYQLIHPDIFNPPAEAIKLGKNLYGDDRNKFWREFMPIIQEQGDKGLID